jgi:hypothetical protein
MHQPLFIHSNTDFSTKIRTEAGPHALVTSSMLQALRWITNPDVMISGIYLNPNDSSYSALRFLELTLLQRPVTPIFLLDEEHEISTPAQKHFFEHVSVKGFFSGKESFTQLIGALAPNENASLNEIKKRITTRSEHPGYLAVPIVDFVHSKTYPFDVFVEDEKKQLRLFATAGSSIESEYLSHVSSKTSWMFVSEANIHETREAIRQTQNTYMDLDAFPISWKTAETLFSAKVLLKEMQKGGLSDGFVEHTQFLLSDIFQIVSHLDHAQKIQKFIDQAKDCDRNIACATLAILMCKAMKFEKNAIVEILGLASFFQDVSLYQSPYGNLSELKQDEMSLEAQQYYYNHAMHSADLLAEHTSMPEVTLQVLRQHHERKDRTGFPNRVGGMQLHPMAEVLSLINDYLDHPLTFSSIEKEVYSHYSDRMVIAFKQLLIMIEKSKALEGTLKEKAA